MTLHSIQLLRFVAATLVTAYHATRAVNRWVTPLSPSAKGIAAVGASGVHIFFVISGFIMVWTCRGAFGQRDQIGPFLQRRAIRVFPIYWLLGTLNLLLSPANGPDGLAEYLGAAALLPGYSGLLIFVGWTLSYELFFYIVFALLLPLRQRWALLSLTALFLCLGASRVLAPPQTAAHALVTNALLLEFVAGAWVGVLFARGPRGPAWSGYLLTALGVLGLAASVMVRQWHLPQVLAWGVPSTLLVLGMLLIESHGRLPKWLTPASRLGDSSYALYLLHAMLIPAIGYQLKWLKPAPPWVAWLIGALLVVGSVAAAHAVYLRVERPLVRAVKGWMSPRVVTARSHNT